MAAARRTTRRVFLLSPARSDGERADVLLSPRATFPLARRLREPGGAPLGGVMTFLSGLYFRGKLTYAETFARPPAGTDGVLVITADSGLVPPGRPLTAASLRRAGRVDIDVLGAVRTGPRPPRLTPIPGILTDAMRGPVTERR